MHINQTYSTISNALKRAEELGNQTRISALEQLLKAKLHQNISNVHHQPSSDAFIDGQLLEEK